MKGDPTTTEEYRERESEAAFQTWAIDELRRHHWLVAHLNDSRLQNATGLPDLICARRGIVLLIELKSHKGRKRSDQEHWLEASGNHLFRPHQRAEFTELVR